MIQTMFQLFTDVWRLAKEFGGCRLTEEQWKVFCARGETLLGKYRIHGEDVEILYRDMFGALQSFYRRKGKRDGGKKE